MAARNGSLFLGLESQTNYILSHATGATLQDDVIADLRFQRYVQN